ncbi:hypothetical protein QN277_029178 [Acacia crassicarpa]|uniref:VQ domain-containing protein n=1 Tax=Acacia crassicarpa TaxID=499986 RepID=A0AAE1J7M8_9FABA|nr:hypothetical protein QN277_029178 [Acacia crassicarpa]
MTQQQHHHQSKHIIKGPRPSPLAINNISHTIGKPSSTAVGAVLCPHGHHHQQQQQQVRKPVIIYTHSPRIIHIKREDFMSFVQKLTGMPRSGDKDVTVSGAGTDNNLESSLSGESIISSMKQEKNNEGQSNFNNEITSSSSAALLNNRYSSTYNYEAPDLNYTDIPLFTPNSSDFLISPYSRSTVFKQSAESPFGILGNLISPSGLEFIKELPDY